jgi:hypothetical protein
MKKSFLLIFAVAIAAAATGIAQNKPPAGKGPPRNKPPAWEPGPRESYPAFLTSEGVTIAVEPLYTDKLAAGIFRKKDMVTRGIMPFAVAIFNDNDFSVEVSGLDIELIHRDRPDIHIKTMSPNEITWRLSQRDKKWQTQRIPRLSQNELDRNMLEDFDSKFLMQKTVAARGNAGGFLYLHLPENENVEEFLSGAMLYIPQIRRLDKGSRMIYFEISLARIFQGQPPKTSESRLATEAKV